ncbi:MAG: hypothetical protein IKG34_09305 [Solobacterium sp.]|nr:hypothetical protein [Solobacterium sp.]
MEDSFRKLVFTELRSVMIPLNGDHLSDESMQRALTMNMNLSTQYGYMFGPKDLVLIARNDAAGQIFDMISGMISELKAPPMYPDFPSQVMSIDEAQFRFHQMLHYFSTYGIEYIFDTDVQRGWLPGEKENITGTEKVTEDEHLFDARVLGLLDEKDAYLSVYTMIISKRERMTDPEKELVSECVLHLEPEQIKEIKVPFKENLNIVFAVMMDTLKGSERTEAMRAVCQHSGDVFKVLKYYLEQHEYHLKTSQKRTGVRLLESYPIGNFKENLILSNTKREETLVVLQFLDYNRFSRSEAHRNAVAMLRNDELHSWEASLKAALAESPEAGLSTAAERPGNLLRSASMLIKAGVEPEKIKAELLKCADRLSTQTLVRLSTYFSNGACGFFENQVYPDSWEDFDTDTLDGIFVEVLKKNLSFKQTPLRGKKIFLEESGYNLDRSVIQTNDKSEEGGYIRSGLTMKVPVNGKIIRLFTYWNDKERVDIDLHGYGVRQDGKTVDIGWADDFRSEKAAMLYSGDITHSDAAEYIDVNLEKAREEGIRSVVFSLHSYTDKTFKEIDEVLVGIMAVSEAGAGTDVKLYTPANCFFSHELRSNTVSITYGFLNIEDMEVTFVGKTSEDWNTGLTAKYAAAEGLPLFTVRSYVRLLAESQGAVLTDSREDADIILRLDKGTEDREVSLIDENYWMDLPSIAE